jgi:hypothetical protein
MKPALSLCELPEPETQVTRQLRKSGHSILFQMSMRSLHPQKICFIHNTRPETAGGGSPKCRRAFQLPLTAVFLRLQ